MVVTKGDTLPNLICIDLRNTTDTRIDKMVVQIGVIQKEILTPVFPVYLSFTSEESRLFSHRNTVDLVVYYGNNSKHTAKGVVEFYADSEQISSSN